MSAPKTRVVDPQSGESIKLDQQLRGFTAGRHHRSLYIRSSDFKPDSDSTNTKITVRLDEPLQITQMERIMCHVTTMTVPFSFYNLDSTLKNDTMYWSYVGTNTSGEEDQTASGTITFGGRNHSVYSFIRVIKDEIGGLTSGGLVSQNMMGSAGDINPIVITYDRASSKLTLKLQTNGDTTTEPLELLPDGTLSIELGNAATGANFYKLIGFAADTTVAFSAASPQTSTSCINLNTVTGLLLNGSFGNRNLVTVGQAQSVPVSKILAVLPITVSPFQFMSLAGATDRPNVNIPGRQISVFDLSLTSDAGDDLDLNGLGWGCTLQFDIEARESSLGPRNLADKLSVLGLREVPRVLPSRYSRSLADIMSGATKRQSNLHEVKERANRKRRRDSDKPAEDTVAAADDKKEQE